MKRAGWYNLPLNRDERKIIYSKLGSLEWTLVRVAYNPNHPITHRMFLIKRCSIDGYLEVLQWLDPMPSTYHLIQYHAIKNGHLHCLKWLSLRGYNTSGDSISICKHLSIIRWIWETTTSKKKYIEYVIQYNAAKYGRKDILEWAITVMPWNHDFIADTMVIYQQWDLLQWASTKGIPMSPDTRNLANEKGWLV